ncbi:hypothetical protein GCM10009557_70140 [Virgisporangium ochraceum]|uniref:Uncharacterized protein n=1 Tax=Virgisporangium ochraceum TaxID=65505 RepID=A0A8J3ZY26_9ACTN|nr:hypothetical protein Voc01_062300 [Virgisporangium ochraceum]
MAEHAPGHRVTIPLRPVRVADSYVVDMRTGARHGQDRNGPVALVAVQPTGVSRWLPALASSSDGFGGVASAGEVATTTPPLGRSLRTYAEYVRDTAARWSGSSTGGTAYP